MDSASITMDISIPKDSPSSMVTNSSSFSRANSSLISILMSSVNPVSSTLISVQPASRRLAARRSARALFMILPKIGDLSMFNFNPCFEGHVDEQEHFH